ncbi:hypothetical protein DM02DRAFT_693069 [Periconia macrospinosa]|uniref:Aminoglycoside phosphotransferase domain-containing protein n=1 Tax=Periconia macrospinosa TaxID=97972 RepID=A0A2V1D8I6_9PLEO|nr:hypothetical protein DM02DRAFT_693069 [Periconia macrospinosa]
MQFDDTAWERSDAIFDAWKEKLFDEDTQRAIANLIKQHRGGVATELCAPQRGSYNVTIRLLFRDGGSGMMRIPCPGIHIFLDEKVRNEVAVMKYISKKTTPLEPFIIMECVSNARTLSEMLNLPGRSNKERHTYIADILLQLSNITFDKIGTPIETAEDDWEVRQRPLTWDMNELVQLANCPSSALHNDAIESTEDCRRKYIARQLFQGLAAERKLHDPALEHGPFRLWCEDLRPGNILLDEDCHILSWWFRGLDHWVSEYEPRMNMFLRSWRAGQRWQDCRKMRKSWVSGRLWINYACRRSWAFDSVFWMFLDRKCFGGNGRGDEYEARLELLGQKERSGIDAFVAKKVEESKVRTLRNWGQ